MKIRGGFRVDAYRVGNYASFINHSCDPNCDARQWDHHGYDRVFIFANRRIPAGTELTYSYSFDYTNTSSFIECKCGAGDKCSGVMGISKARLKKNKVLRNRV